MEHHLFPSVPNTAEVNDLKDFCWGINTSASVGVRHCTSRQPILELLTPGPVTPPMWMADLLSWSERGEFILAAGRGLVACLAVRGVRVRGTPDESSPHTFRVEGPNGPALLRCEWDEELEFRPVREGWLEARGLDNDVPLMVYIQAAEPGGDEALTRKKLERFERVDLGALVSQVQKYQNDLPLWQTEPELEALWNCGLHLHRASTYTPQPPYSFHWETPCRSCDARRTLHGHRYALQGVWDWLLLNPERARQEFANFMRGFDEDSGMMATCTHPTPPATHPETASALDAARDMTCSHPPLWPFVAWNLYLVLRDRNFLEEMLRIGLRNTSWWEENRRSKEGLFAYAETVSPETGLSESGYQGSPRFDEPAGGRCASVDLSCQMALFYLCLKRFAGQLNESALSRDLQTRYDALCGLIRTSLWDDETGFFYDLRQGKPVRVRTTASFFSLLAGVATDEQVVRLSEHIASESEFFRQCPVPSVAADEPAFRHEGWRGLSSLAETLWVVAGLRNADRPRLAAQVARRALNSAARVLTETGSIREFYNPESNDQSETRSVDGQKPVASYHLGNAPLHALAALGLYGIEMTRDGLLIDPVGVALPPQSVIEIQLPETRLTVIVRRTDALDGIELKVRAGKHILGEGYGRTVIGLGKLL